MRLISEKRIAFLFTGIVLAYLLIFPSSVLAEAAMNIRGMVFNDIDGDGFRATDEPGLPGWTLTLIFNGNNISKSTTDDLGQYKFTNLSSGKYTVIEDKQADWNLTSPPDGNYIINLLDNDSINDFGNHKVALAAAHMEHPVMSRDMWLQRGEAIRNMPKAGANPELRRVKEAISYPASYSLLSYVPIVDILQRNQGSCGNCWVWGNTVPIEVAHQVQNGISDRLSIQYLNSNYESASAGWACCGGWETDFASFYSTQGKFIPWNNANANWKDGGNGCCQNLPPACECSGATCCSDVGCNGLGSTSQPDNDIDHTSYYPITSIAWQEIQTTSSDGVDQNTAINNIKSYLSAGRAITLSYYLPDWFYFTNKLGTGYWDTSKGVWDPDAHCGDSIGADPANDHKPGGHAVTIVGWNDATGPDTAYWIVLNSWGAGPNGDGTFKLKMYMNYDCVSLGVGNDRSYSFGFFDVTFSPWSRLGGIITSSPSVIVDNLGKTETWVRGSDNALYVKIDSVWYNKGGILASDPFAAKDYNGKIHVLVRGSDNAAWDFIYNPVTTTGQWKCLGGIIKDGPTAAMEPTYNSIMKVAARGSDNALWYCDLYINTGATQWYTVGGVLTSAPYVIFDPSRIEHTFVRGGDNALWDNRGVLGTGNQYHFAWNSLGGVLASEPTASIVPGNTNKVAAFVKGSDNALWICDVNSANTPETCNWYGFGGVLNSRPFAIADTSANKLHIFALGSDSALWENVFTTSPWSPAGNQWQGLGGSILYSPGAAIIDSKTRAFAIGTDHGLWQYALGTASTMNHPPNTPSPPIGSPSGTPGTPNSYSTSATDPDNDQLKYTFYWDDGTPDTETGYVSSGTSQSLPHTWSTTGTYQVKAKATDSKGAISAWSSTTPVTITTSCASDRAPTVPVPSGPTAGSSGTPYIYSTSANDPDSGDQVQYTFDWADETTSLTPWVSPGTTASATHSWSVPAGSTTKFNVRTRATDKCGKSSDWTYNPLSVTITAPGEPTTVYFTVISTWSGARIPGALIKVTDGAGNSKQATTDASGMATISGTSGTWTVTVSATGYITNTLPISTAPPTTYMQFGLTPVGVSSAKAIEPQTETENL